MIKIYGMPTCPDCSYLHDQIEGKEDKYEYVDIGSHVLKLKEFLKLRDNSSVFDEAKEKGYAGIPCFLFEDGSVSLTAEDAGLKSRPMTDDAPACSIADHLAGKKGC